MKKTGDEFVAAQPHAPLSTGEVIRMLRELKGWTQAELARFSGISTTNLSLLENEKVDIGKKRTNNWQELSMFILLSSCSRSVSQKRLGGRHIIEEGILS